MSTSEYAHTFVYLLNEKFKNEGEFASKNFSVMSGKKYDRIVQETSGDKFGGSRSVHAFVERATGHVFKAAGWPAPAKGVRYLTVEEAAEAADLYGGYLYAR